jgi:hypothetical protein
VAAIASPDLAGAGTMVSLGKTDNTGRFLLENVPSGSYYIIAGRIDRPTFYPGTLEPANATPLTIKAGDRLSDVNLVIAEASFRPAASSPATGQNKIEVSVPVAVTVEGEGALPPAPEGKTPVVRLVPIAGGSNLEAPLNARRIAIPVSSVTEEYRVHVENLPDGYRVKSITFGSADLAAGTLKASQQELSAVAPPRIVTYTGQGELQRIIDEIMQRREASRTLSITLVKN